MSGPPSGADDPAAGDDATSRRDPSRADAPMIHLSRHVCAAKSRPDGTDPRPIATTSRGTAQDHENRRRAARAGRGRRSRRTRSRPPRGPRRDRRTARAARSAGRKRPASSRLPGQGALRAPGMWPGRGSIAGSPAAYRSALRASRIVASPAASSSADTKRCAGHGRGVRSHRLRRRDRSVSARRARPPARRRAPPPVRRARAAATTAGPRSSRRRRRRRRPGCRSAIPARPSAAAKRSGDGSGWRPSAGVAGSDSSVSMSSQTAPGMCPAA